MFKADFFWGFFSRWNKKLPWDPSRGVFGKSFCWRFPEWICSCVIWRNGGNYLLKREISELNLRKFRKSQRNRESAVPFDEVCWICCIVLRNQQKVGSCHWALQYDRGLCSLWKGTLREGAFQGASIYLIHVCNTRRTWRFVQSCWQHWLGPGKR